jgi:hypothetical protein
MSSRIYVPQLSVLANEAGARVPPSTPSSEVPCRSSQLVHLAKGRPSGLGNSRDVMGEGGGHQAERMLRLGGNPVLYVFLCVATKCTNQAPKECFRARGRKYASTAEGHLVS